MITDPDPGDRAGMLAALRSKLLDVQYRQRLNPGKTDDQQAELQRLWQYAGDLRVEIEAIEQELGIVSQVEGLR